MNDPYTEPFEWSYDYTTPIPILFGLIPHDCEAGFYPLLNGDEIECPTCRLTT